MAGLGMGRGWSFLEGGWGGGGVGFEHTGILRVERINWGECGIDVRLGHIKD